MKKIFVLAAILVIACAGAVFVGGAFAEEQGENDIVYSAKIIDVKGEEHILDKVTFAWSPEKTFVCTKGSARMEVPFSKVRSIVQDTTSVQTSGELPFDIITVDERKVRLLLGDREILGEDTTLGTKVRLNLQDVKTLIFLNEKAPANAPLQAAPGSPNQVAPTAADPNAPVEPGKDQTPTPTGKEAPVLDKMK
jgi:hypothetical protein